MKFIRKISIVVALVFIISAVLGGIVPVSSQKVEGASKKVVTFTMFSADATVQYHPDIFSTAIGQEITKKTGVRLKIEHFVGMDQATKISLMLASGDLPDLVYGSGEHKQFIQNKALVPLDNYIEKYGQWTKKAYSSADLKKLRQADGHIYFLSYTRGEVSPSASGEGLYVMIDMLQKNNWPRLKYWEDLVPMIRNYVKKYPKYKGMPVIGMSAITEGARFYVIQDPATGLNGLVADTVQVDPKTYKASYDPAGIGMYKAYKALNALWNEGLFDKEAFVQTYDQWAAKVAQGRVVTSWGRSWHFNTAFNTLRKNNEDDRILVPFGIVFKGVKKSRYVMLQSIGTRDGVSITKKCKDPVRAFQFLDQMLNPEVQKLMFWGIKGRDYLVDKKGKMYRTQAMIDKARDPVYQKQEGLGYWNIWPRWQLKLPDGNYVKPELDPDIAYMQWAPAQKKVLDAYKAKTFVEPPFADEPESPPWGYAWEINIPPEKQKEIQVPLNIANDLARKYIPMLVMAPKGKYDEVWNKYKAEVRAKINTKPIEEFYTEQMRQRMADWYGIKVK